MIFLEFVSRTPNLAHRKLELATKMASQKNTVTSIKFVCGNGEEHGCIHT